MYGQPQQQEEEIIVQIDRDGAVNLETLGFIGSSCEKNAQLLSDLMGTTHSVEHKPEYHHSAPNNRQGQRQQTRF